MKNVGIYVQVPFCQTRCTYCNFHTGVVGRERFGPYVDAVCAEVRGHRELYEKAGVEWTAELNGAVVDSVYVGGGTPSLLEAADLGRILEAIGETFGGKARRKDDKKDATGQAGAQQYCASSARSATDAPGAPDARGASCARRGNETNTAGARGVEVTLEADPETVDGEKAAGWVEAGINRVSLGVQSFMDGELAAAGRMHRVADVYRATAILREAGIGNISFDLIAGLAHQTRGSWRESLEKLVGLGPEHVSVYLLEVDEGSRLGKELLGGGTRYSARAVPAEDEMAEFYEMAQRALGDAGYVHYEISNWAKPGRESRHNLKYWRREAYLGFGAGAHSFSGRQRWANAHDAAEYVGAIVGETHLVGIGGSGPASARLPIEQLESVTQGQALEEELFLGLRQLKGIDVERIEREYGARLGEKIARLEAAGLVEKAGDVLRLVEKRLSVANEAFVELMGVERVEGR